MSGATPVGLLIVDDSRDLVEVFTLTARLEPGIRVVGSLFSADGLVERIGELSPDVALVDLTMPGKDPLEAVREAAAAHPATRCLICSGYHDPERAAAVAEAGAWGLVSKGGDIAAILDAVRRVAGGERIF